MKKAKKVVALALCAVMLVVGSVAGTMAYLTSSTDAVTNKFTVGNVAITLDETDVTVYGVKDTDERVKANEYKLVPGHTYVKDPTVHVAANSEDCFLFVKVVDGLAAIEDETTIASQMAAKGWNPLYVTDAAGNSVAVENVYYYKDKVLASTTVQDFVVFENFKLKGDADVSTYATTNNTASVITIDAYAIQADGFAGPGAAWTAAPTSWSDAPAQA